MKQKVVLILSVVIGLLAALLSRQFLNAKEREFLDRHAELSKRYRNVDVYTVREDLIAGSQLKMEDIGIKAFPEASLGTHAIRAEGRVALSLIGKRLAVTVKRETPLSWTDIEGGNPASVGLAAEVTQRLRAVSINVSGAASVSGMIRPNNKVDVLGTFSFPAKDRPGEMELVTLTVLQDVNVLATGRTTALMGDPSSRGASAYSTVTLEVTPHEAEMLVFAEQIKGRLTLTLRNPEDKYYENELPTVNFDYIQKELETLNTYRQEKLLRKSRTRL